MKKAFRWLLVHPIAFAWILAAIAILLNWIVGSGSPPKKEHEAKAGQHVVHEQKMAGQEQKSTGAEATATTEQATTPAQTAAAMPATTETNTTTQVAATREQASASVAEQAAATAVAPVTAAVATTAAAGQAVTENSSAEDLLLAAREAYWSGEYDRSVGFYQSLLKKDNKPDYKGELANVYWKQGKSTDAVGLYAEIAPWLAQQGRTAELQSIKVYADVVDPTKAAEIGTAMKK